MPRSFAVLCRSPFCSPFAPRGVPLRLPVLTALALAGAALLWAPAAAAAFPPVPDSARQLTEVAGSPDAAAVVLDEKAEFWIQNLRDPRPSTLRVFRRVKVLTAEGAEDWGEVEIAHSREWRLSNFEGRTVLPDGRELAVDQDSVFRRVSSRSEKEFVTAAAFPAVAPGAILDLSYELSVDSIFFLEPWFFQAGIPVLRSEIEYHIPSNVAVKVWGSSLPGQEFQQTVDNEKDGRRLRVWLEDLPPIPDEPFSRPAADLSARFMLVPTEIDVPGGRVQLMSSWKEVCKLMDEQVYESLGRKSKAVRQKVREVRRAAPDGGRALAEALFRYVRDEVRTAPRYSVFTRSKVTLEDIMEEGVGTLAEKALLLQALLREADLDTRLLWVADRRDGLVDPSVANPSWFEKVIVQVQVPEEGGTRAVLLDPSDRRLGFGHLHAHNEGVVAVLYDVKDPKVATTPETPAALNRRSAEVDLTLDAEGRLSGGGTLTLSGHHATRNLQRSEEEDAGADSWREWLAERWPGFEISELAVSEDLEGRQITVTFQLRQRPEEVLGDESSLALARPLGPVDQPFQLTPEERRTPVMLSFGDIDAVTTTVTWPEGWEVELVPEELQLNNAAGLASVTTTVDAEARSLTYQRTFMVKRREFVDSPQYGALRALFGDLEARDAQSLVLVGP